MRRVTIDDVAREAGVSRQTVSRAINEKGEISAETRERVLTAIQKLGYRPNRLAQSMITQRTYTLGVEVADITNSALAEMVRGAQDSAAQRGYNVFLTNSDDEPTIAIQALSNLVMHNVDGLIAMVSGATDEEIRAFAERYRPLVLINRVVEHPNIALISSDIYRGGSLAVEHLIQQGHSAIGMLANPFSPHLSARRVEAYQDTLRRYARPINPAWIVRAAPTLQGGYEATRQLLADHPEVTAIFGYNDLMSIGALRACRDLGRQVPQDCAVIGFDDIPLAALVTPSLSTVRYDKYALGQQAVLRLLDMIESPGTPFPPIELGVELVLRESTLPALDGQNR